MDDDDANDDDHGTIGRNRSYDCTHTLQLVPKIRGKLKTTSICSTPSWSMGWSTEGYLSKDRVTEIEGRKDVERSWRILFLSGALSQRKLLTATH